jgi:hypothetical protein
MAYRERLENINNTINDQAILIFLFVHINIPELEPVIASVSIRITQKDGDAQGALN